MIRLEELTYEQCVVQGIGPLVFPHRLGKPLSSSPLKGGEEEQRRMQMKAVCVRNMQMQAKMMVVLEKAWSALEEAGIKAVLMKGLGLAQYYPAVEQRQWGDIDLYVGPEQYHPACAVMRATFPEALKFDEELDHYKHYNLIADGVSIEVHRVTMGMMHPRDVRRYARMEQYGMEHAVPMKYINTDKHAYGAINIDKEEKKNDIKNTESSVTDSNSIVTAPQSACMQASRQTDDPFRLTDTDAQYLSDDSDKNTKNNTLPIGNVECLQKCVVPPYKNDKNNSDQSSYKLEIRVPEVTFNALFVMLHSWEHMMHGSANLRQICDLALLLKHEQEKIDRERLKKWLEELRLMDVWQLYMYIAVEMFGLKAEEASFYATECAERAEKMVEDMLAGPRVKSKEKREHRNRFVRKWRTMKERLGHAEEIVAYSPEYARHMKVAVLLSGAKRLFAKDRRWE